MEKNKIFPFTFMFLLALTPFLSVEIPRFLAFFPLIIGLISCTWMYFFLKIKLEIPRFYLLCAGSISGLCVLSTIWSIAPEHVIIDSLKITAILLCGGILISACRAITAESIRPYRHFLSVGVIAGALLTLIELNFDLPVFRVFHYLEPGQKINTAEMNRGIICIIFTYFIALGFSIDHTKTKLKDFILPALMTLAVIIMLIQSQTQSGQLGFLLGVLALAFFPAKYKNAYNILALVIIAIIAISPFIISALYDTLIGTAQNIPWLSDAYAGNRSEIWNFVMLYAMHNPLYGYGMEATRYVPHFDHLQLYHKNDTVLHPHNFAVQIWIEFGMLGVIVFGTVITAIMRKISDIPVTARRYILGTLTAVFLTAAVAYGMWQSWWIGLLIYISALSELLRKLRKIPE